MIMSSCLEKGEGRSGKPTSTQSKALFLKCWRLRYFLLKHGRYVNYHTIQMKLDQMLVYLKNYNIKGSYSSST